jgi:hypothetical protein
LQLQSGGARLQRRCNAPRRTCIRVGPFLEGADMDTNLKRALIQLARGELHRIAEAQGRGVATFHGRVWITQHGDPRDTVLSAGESVVLDRPGMAIVQALAASSVLVFEHASSPRAQAEPARVSIDVSELQRRAKDLRNAAIDAALRRLGAALRRLWQRVWSGTRAPLRAGDRHERHA